MEQQPFFETKTFALVFWSSEIIDCMLFTFDNRVLLMRLGASVVWHLLFPLMNRLNKTEAAFSCRLCFLMASSFVSLIGTVSLEKIDK